MSKLKMYYVTCSEERRKDPIYAIPFANDCMTGLISYVKTREDESISYVHTLNAGSGFQRKLEAINVVLSDEYLVNNNHSIK